MKTNFLRKLVWTALFAASLGSFNLQAFADEPRVVSIAPSLTEIVFKLGKGSCLVGRSSACDYPAEAAKVRVVGAFGSPSLEQLAVLRPRFVFATSLSSQSLKEGIARTGATLLLLPSSRLEDYPKSVEAIGEALGCPEAAAKEAARFREGLERYRAEAAKTPVEARPKVYLEVWRKPLMSCGSGSFVDEMIEAAGGVNIGRVQSKDYFPCSEEWVLTSAPDVIICPSMGSGSAGEVLARKGWGGVPAVKSKRVSTGLEQSLIFRLGPRTLDGIAALKACLEGGELK